MTIIEKIKKGNFELYLHPSQKTGWIEGNELYQHLKDENLLDGCATEEDLKEIQKEGIEFFREHFGNNFIFAWKYVQDSDGSLNIPYLYENGVKVLLHWLWIGSSWSIRNPGLRHASNPKNSVSKPSISLDLSPEEHEALKSVLTKLVK